MGSCKKLFFEHLLSSARFFTGNRSTQKANESELQFLIEKGTFSTEARKLMDETSQLT